MNARWATVVGVAALLVGCPDPDPEPGVIPGLQDPAVIALVPVAPSADPVTRASACADAMAAAPGARPERGDPCALEPTQPILGARAASGATLVLDVGRGVPRCGPVDEGQIGGLRVRYIGDDGAVTGEVVAVDWSCAEQELGEDAAPCVERFLGAAWQMIADLGLEGFVGARDERTAIGRSQTAEHDPVAVLGGPLDGWMLFIRDTAAGPLELVLVNPANTDALPLAQVPESAQDGALGSIHHVALGPDDRLHVTVGIHAPGACTPEAIHVVDAPIPAAAR